MAYLKLVGPKSLFDLPKTICNSLATSVLFSFLFYFESGNLSSLVISIGYSTYVLTTSVSTSDFFSDGKLFFSQIFVSCYFLILWISFIFYSYLLLFNISEGSNNSFCSSISTNDLSYYFTSHLT